jgi:hypothetical protein
MGTGHKFRKHQIFMYGRMERNFKFDGEEEIKPCKECTYLGTIIDQLGDNTTEIKHRICQTIKATNGLISNWCTKILLKTENCIFIKL